MSGTVWYYQFRAADKPRKVSARAAGAFQEGAGTLTPALDGYVYLAEVCIDLLDRRPISLVSMRCSRHPVDIQGRWLEADRSATKRTTIESLDHPAERASRPDGWQPTATEVAELVDCLEDQGVPRHRRDNTVN
jgi:hypothetical protein